MSAALDSIPRNSKNHPHRPHPPLCSPAPFLTRTWTPDLYRTGSNDMGPCPTPRRASAHSVVRRGAARRAGCSRVTIFPSLRVFRVFAHPRRDHSCTRPWILTLGRGLHSLERAWAAWRGLRAAREAVCGARQVAVFVFLPNVRDDSRARQQHSRSVPVVDCRSQYTYGPARTA